jgi:glycosyltransferase involved in cell wall biosynthesis
MQSLPVAVVYPRANLDTVPSLVGLIEGFAKRGFVVDVFTQTTAGEPPVAFAQPNVHLRSLGVQGLADQSTAQLREGLRRARWLPQPARAPLARGYSALRNGVDQGSRLLARVRRRGLPPYACVIGVDPDGLILAQSIADGAPLGYFSLELLLWNELVTAELARVKMREAEISRRAAFVIIQDQARAQLLVKDNKLAWPRVVLLPNTPDGPARREPSGFWHARFDLDASCRIVLHAGSLGDWTGIESIVDGVACWPSSWRLVIHTRYDAESSPYVEALRTRADPGRVLFSLKPVQRQEYDALVDGADVGIAFYVPDDASEYTGVNIKTIGLSSGKLAYYLRAGLPVVVSAGSSIAEQVAAAGCGVAVDDAAQVGAALDQIAAGYGRYSAAACAFFERHLNLRRGVREVIEHVEALAMRA